MASYLGSLISGGGDAPAAAPEAAGGPGLPRAEALSLIDVDDEGAFTGTALVRGLRERGFGGVVLRRFAECRFPMGAWGVVEEWRRAGAGLGLPGVGRRRSGVVHFRLSR